LNGDSAAARGLDPLHRFAASGIGRASALRLAEEGAQIVVADRAKADL
jgi:hypothetical protein